MVCAADTPRRVSEERISDLMPDHSLVSHLEADNRDLDGNEALRSSINIIIEYANGVGYELHHDLCGPLLVLINRIEDNNIAPLVSGDLPSDLYLDRINSLRQTLIEERKENLPDAA